MINEFLKKNKIFSKLKKINIEEFNSSTGKNSGIILVEFNSFHILHIIFATFSIPYSKSTLFMSFKYSIIDSFSISKSFFFGEDKSIMIT